MTNKYITTFTSIIFLGMLFTCFVSSTLAAPQTQPTLDKSEVLPLRLETFVDRVILKKDEPLNVQVWVKSKLMNSATVDIFYAKEQLTLAGNHSQPISLSQDSPVTFEFTGNNVGKSNLLIQVTGINKQTKEPITLKEKIENIEIKPLSQWWLNPVITSFLGVFSGVFATFMGTSLNNWRQERKEKKNRRKWIKDNLRLQLRENHKAVSDKKEATYTSWMSTLLTEGYYTELLHLAEQQNNQTNLIEILFAIERDLKNYENARSNNRLTNKMKRDLEEKIAKAIKFLTQIAAN